MSRRWRPRLRGHGSPPQLPTCQSQMPAVYSPGATQLVNPAIKPSVSHLSVLPSTCQPLQPASQPVSPVSLSFPVNRPVSQFVSQSVGAPSVGQPVSRSVGRVTRLQQFPVGPCAISGLCRRRGRGSAGTRGAGAAGPLTWRRDGGLARAPQLREGGRYRLRWLPRDDGGTQRRRGGLTRPRPCPCPGFSDWAADSRAPAPRD